MNKRVVSKWLSVFVSAVLCFCAFLSVPISAYAEENGSGENQSEQLTLPKIVVTTENGNGCELEKSDGYVGAHITITDTDGSVLDDSVSFKVRGNTTSLSWITKKPFTFKFSKKKNVLGMGKGKKWALIANAFDPTLLRNYLAFDIAHELELPYASNQKFVELWVDGSFRGSYILYEPVQEGSDRVDIDIESNNGMKDFLVEFEAIREEEDTTYFKSEGFRFIASDPDEPNEEQLGYIQDTMTDIIKTIKKGDREQIAEKIDLSSFAKYYLLNEYIKTYDFNMTSVFFFYKDGVLYAGPPWDYDLSMGNSNPDCSERCKNAHSPQDVYANKNLFTYLADKAWFMELVKAEYELHYDYFSAIHTDGGLLDTLRSTYSETIDRNYDDAGWRVSKWWINIQLKPGQTYEDNYDYLKNWLTERNAWFEEYLEPFYRDFINGDADGDGKVDISDVTKAQMIIAGLVNDTEAAVRGNVASGKLDITDVTELQMYIAKLDTPDGIGEQVKKRIR